MGSAFTPRINFGKFHYAVKDPAKIKIPFPRFAGIERWKKNRRKQEVCLLSIRDSSSSRPKMIPVWKIFMFPLGGIFKRYIFSAGEMEPTLGIFIWREDWIYPSISLWETCNHAKIIHFTFEVWHQPAGKHANPPAFLPHCPPWNGSPFTLFYSFDLHFHLLHRITYTCKMVYSIFWV